MRVRYYYRPDHPQANANGFVSSEEVGDIEVKRAVDAPILAGRFYENVAAQDGTDIGSRKKHREYMKANGLTITSDFTETWAKARQEREAVQRGTHNGERKAIREEVGRALYQRYKS